MALVDLALAKKHLRIYHDDEDAELEVYLAAAESIVVEYLDRPVLPADSELPLSDAEGYDATTAEGYDATTVVVTPPIIASILLVVSDLFERREAPEKDSGDAVLQPTVRRLLAPWRVWRTVDDCAP